MCVSASTPGEEPGRLQAELRNQISQASAVPCPHGPRQVHQGLVLILILFKKGKVTPQFHLRQFTPRHWPQLQLPQSVVPSNPLIQNFFRGNLIAAPSESHTGNTSPSKAVAGSAPSNPVT